MSPADGLMLQKGEILFHGPIHPGCCGFVFFFGFLGGFFWFTIELIQLFLARKKLIFQSKVFGLWVRSSMKVMCLEVWWLESAQQRLWNGSEKEEQDTPAKEEQDPAYVSSQQWGWTSSLFRPYI